MSSTLFELANEYVNLYQLAVSEEAEDEQVFLDTLEGLMGEIDVKGAGIVAVVNRLDMEMKKAEEIEERYKAHKNACKNSIKQIKERCLIACQTMGVNELPAGDLTIKVKKNGGALPVIIDGDVPENMNKVTIEPDRTKIANYLKGLKDGEECKWAHFGERGSHIEIK